MPLTTMATAATTIISTPLAGSGSRRRTTASQPIASAMNTSDTALTSAAMTPIRW